MLQLQRAVLQGDLCLLELINSDTDAEDEGEESLMMMRGDQEDCLPCGRTMRLLSALHEDGLCVLLDTGTTHIIDESLALRLGLPLRRI